MGGAVVMLATDNGWVRKGQVRDPARPPADTDPEVTLESGALDEALRALGHLDRRAILRVYLTEEQAAGDLAALSDLSLATVSEHLKVLRKSGLLRLDRRGRFWMYRTDAALLDAVTCAFQKLGDP
ncbi:DNA-binding transcriptional regulator, ArsR family [Rhizobium sp. RU20A]|nr:DNA-binding transcriptional regulator, ArsR family [Rhizobium sp. RU20A]